MPSPKRPVLRTGPPLYRQVTTIIRRVSRLDDVPHALATMLAMVFGRLPGGERATMRNQHVDSAVVEVADLYARFPAAGATREVLAGVSFRASPGEIVGLVGPAGAGKTTLLRLLAGTIPPSAGRVLFEGQALASDGDAPAAVRLVGVELPEFGARPVEQLLSATGRQGSDVTRVARALGLWERRAEPASRLAPRWRQSLALALALLDRPRLLPLDEPPLGSGAAGEHGAAELLRGTAADGCTLLLGTSRADMALRLCERLIVLHEGRVAADLPASAVQRQHRRRQYQIRVLGHLGTGWAEGYEGIQIVTEPSGNTLLVGNFHDQLALHGLIARIGQLGLTLLDVQSTTPDVETLCELPGADLAVSSRRQA